MTTEDFKTYNNKRAFRRRQLHTWSRRLAEVQAKPLKDMNQDQLEKIQQDLYKLESTMEGLGEEAFQTLSEESDLLAKEQDAQEQFEQELFLVLELVNRLIKLKKIFTRHRKVQLEGKTLISMGPDACLVERRYDDFISTCQDLITEDVALLDHTQMAAEYAATEALMGEVQKCLSTKKVPHNEDDGEDDAPTRRSGPIIMGPGLNLEMPHFDGQPRNWAKFKRMFQIVLDTRGSHYDAVAKSVLLENSMKTKDAKDVVIRNSTGDDPYNKAMTALSEKYGNPRVLLPILVRDLTHNEDVYAYTKEGLQALYDQYVTSYEHLQDIIADSLTTYLCQCAREHFSPKLREEWDRYASPLTALPTIADIRNFVNKLVNQMEPTSTYEDDVPEKEIQNANILTVNLPDDDDFNLPYDDPGDDDDAPKLTYDEDANGRNPSTKSQATSPSTCKEAPRDSGEVTTPPRESVRDMAVPVPPWAGSQALYRRATYSSPAEDKQSPETTPLDSTPSSVDYVD